MDSEKFIQNFNTILSLFLFKKKKRYFLFISKQRKMLVSFHIFFSNFKFQNFKISKFKFQFKKKNPLDVCVCFFFFLRLLFLARSVRHSVNCYRSYKKNNLLQASMVIKSKN